MSQGTPQTPAQAVLVMQIITLSLVMGPVTFLMVVLFALDGEPADEPMQSYIAAGTAVVMIFTQFLIRMHPDRSILPQNQRDGDFDPHSDEMFMAFVPTLQTEHIIRIAMLEGAAFYNIIAFQLERQAWSLGIVALLLGLIAIQFPTISRIQQRIENETRFWSQSD